MSNQRFDEQFIAKLQELFCWRRDVRRFLRQPLPEGLLDELLASVSYAPSVGLSEPWRFLLVESAACRLGVRDNFLQANERALQGYDGEKAKLYASLKLEGLDQAPVHLGVFCDQATEQGSGLGRQSMPEMLEYSVVAAIQTFWLAARARGVGVGWLSILDPARLCQCLQAPASWKPVAYLCVGFPEREDDTPELSRAGWEHRKDFKEFLFKR